MKMIWNFQAEYLRQRQERQARNMKKVWASSAVAVIVASSAVAVIVNMGSIQIHDMFSRQISDENVWRKDLPRNNPNKENKVDVSMIDGEFPEESSWNQDFL